MERTREIIKVSIRGIVINILLVIFKAIVGLAANAISVVLDAVNNLSDALSSLITIIGTKLAGKAPDKNHPYGHGRIEYLTSLVIALIVLAAGVTSMKESVEKIIEPVHAEFTVITLIVIIAGIITKFFMGRYFIAMGKKLNSGSLSASGTDASFDAIITTATLVSALFSMIADINIEGWLGAAISVFILKAGLEILRETINSIIGVRIDQELSVNVKMLINKHPKVLGCYDLLLHSYGPEENMGSVHVEVADEMTAKEIDEMTRTIALDVYKTYGVMLTIGIYASNTDNEFALEMKSKIVELIKDQGNVLGMHGFYVDEIKNIVVFDLIFDFEEKDPARACDSIRNKISPYYPDYQFYINIDRDFSD